MIQPGYRRMRWSSLAMVCIFVGCGKVGDSAAPSAAAPRGEAAAEPKAIAEPKTATDAPTTPPATEPAAAPVKAEKASLEGAVSDDKTSVVIAEGAGTNADDALRDAFRKAVGKVVGAYVDEETLVKNDEVITDQVLTYSDGIVKKYEDLGTRADKGLVRVKIKAAVERRSVVARLKVANVTVKEVDGKSLFGEIVTEMEGARNAREVLANALKGFPLNCLTATVEGSPEKVEAKPDRATIRIKVRFAADIKAYDAFAGRLMKVLDAIAKEKGEFSVAGERPEGESLDLWDARFKKMNDDSIGGAGRALFNQSKEGKGSGDGLYISVNTHRTRTADRTEWRRFKVDPVVRPLLAGYCVCSPTVKLSLLDGDGTLVAVDRFPASPQKIVVNRGNLMYFYVTPIVAVHYQGLMNPHYVKAGYNESAIRGLLDSRPPVNHFLISPLIFGGGGNYSDSVALSGMTSVTGARDLTLTLDEIKRIQSVKCELTYDGELPPPVKVPDRNLQK